MNDLLIAPTGECIAQSTFQTWLEKNNLSMGDRLTAEQENEVNAIALTDEVTLDLLASKKEEKKQKITLDISNNELIAAVTNGLNRESAMALCPLKGYWPDVINKDGLTVYSNGYRSRWETGTPGWTVAVELNGPDHGSGYGFNTND